MVGVRVTKSITPHFAPRKNNACRLTVLTSVCFYRYGSITVRVQRSLFQIPGVIIVNTKYFEAPHRDAPAGLIIENTNYFEAPLFDAPAGPL